MISKILAVSTVDDVIGKITPPVNISGIDTNNPQSSITSLVKIMNVTLELVLVIALIFVLVNFLLAGFKYVTGGGDAKKIAEANIKITHTVIGLLIIVVAPLIAALFGIILFGRWDAILNPTFKTLGP